MACYSGSDPEKLVEMQAACAERYRKLAQRRKEESNIKGGKITIKPVSESIASCNACLARNYDPVIETGVGERVDTLYEIHDSSSSSGLSFCLCRDCLCKLVGEAYLACNPASTTKEETHD